MDQIKLKNFLVVFALIFFVLVPPSTQASCPCQSKDLCEPVTKKYTKELVVFSCAVDPLEWKHYNWSEITHVIVCGTHKDFSSLYCHAHSNQVRVTFLAPVTTKDFSRLHEPAYRKSFVDSWLNTTTYYHFDGVNMDVEGAAFTNDVKTAINQLTKETYQSFKAANSDYIVTFDIPYSPYLAGCVSFYCFDYFGISKYTDYMIVMDYDANIDVYLAQANSPMFLVEEGLNFYIKNFSISPERLVMAVPWYGYDFECKDYLNQTGKELCIIFGNGHTQRCYGDIFSIVSNNALTVNFNGFSKSVFVTLEVNGTYHQIWFDNSKSLAYKYDLAQKLGLGGLSMWRSDCLNYTSEEPSAVHENNRFWSDITIAMKKLKG